MKGLLIFMMMFVSVNRTDQLIGTVWTCQIAKGCVDTLKFKYGRKVEEYDCELNYDLRGSYTIQKDTLLLTMKDDSHSEDNGKVSYYRVRYLITRNALCCVGNGELIDGRWHDKVIKIDKNAGYRRFK